MPKPFALLRVLSVFAIALWCHAALAAAPSPQERERARALMDQGDARFEAGAYDAALEAYRAADAIMGVPTTAIEVARVLEKLGRLLQAREVLSRVVASPARADEPKAFVAARQRAALRVAEIAQRIPRLSIRVVGMAAGTEPRLSLDGQALPAPQTGTLELDPGAHRLVGNAPGYREAASDFTLTEGEVREVRLPFSEHGAAAKPAVVPARVEPPRQDHRGATARGKRVLLWSSLGLAAVGLGVGTVTGLKSLSLTKDVEGRCAEQACPPEASDDLSSARTLANVSNVAFAVGVAAAALSTWQLLSTSGKEPKAARGRPRLDVAVGVGAVSLQGAF